MGWTVADDQEAFYRSQGWSGTRWDSPRDDGSVNDTGSKARTDYLTEKLREAAGDDGSLSYDEYATAIQNSPDKYAYNPDTTSNALARFGSSTGFNIDQDALNQNNLSYEGADIIQKLGGEDGGPNRAYKDSVSYLRTEDDGDDDSFNFFKWSAADLKEEEEEEVVVTPEVPDLDCPSGQVRGTSGTCIEDKKYAENPWEEPKKVPEELAERRTDWDENWNPSREVKDTSDLGSIDYLSPYMKSQSKYQTRLKDGAFSGFLRANQYQEDKKYNSDNPVKARDIAYYQSN